MISIESIRRYPFFSGLNLDQMTILAKVAQEIQAEAGESFFREGDELDKFYLVVEGSVDIAIGVTDPKKQHSVADQITNNFDLADVSVSTVGIGEIFGWSALIPPHHSTASAVASKSCRVLAFDCEQLRPILAKDCHFALIMTRKAAQVVRNRLRDMHVESLAFVSA